MPPSYTLYTPEASFRAFATLIAAEYNGISVNVETDLQYASKSPVHKLPVLETTTTGKIIFSSAASARYMASLRRDSGLVGASALDAAHIDAWMDWAATDLELPATVWFYPVAGYMPFNPVAYVLTTTCLSCCCCCSNLEVLLRGTYTIVGMLIHS